MTKPTDIRPSAASLWFLPVHTRMPLKFGAETVTYVTVARACVTVTDRDGRTAQGWGETPLSVTWVWPSSLSYEARHEALKDFCCRIARDLPMFSCEGHPLEVGHAYLARLRELLDEANAERAGEEPMPWLGALVCLSLFDIALHDAYGVLHGVPVYDTYNATWMNHDLSAFLEPAVDADVTFEGLYPADFLVDPPTELPAWHLVGGKDPVASTELTGSEPDDGYPVLLDDWIRTDGLTCLKIKLVGTDQAWDLQRIITIGQRGIELGVEWLTCDFNCTVLDVAYVNEVLDQLVATHPRIYGMILYVEQPFPYDLDKHRIDVHSVSARKPLFMDESAHDWEHVRTGRQLGWTGVALKTCKTQSGALLSLCWAKAHGMTLMVQDLTNPMLAQVPHVLLAAHAGTIMGVETNAMQFYPAASEVEAATCPGLYQRRGGVVSLAGIEGPGFGYPRDMLSRELPTAAV